MSSNCFPESWIGKEPVKVGDGGVYYIGNDSTKQIFLPSGYKGLSTEWLNNGVLRIDTNINNTKLFYVGCQRYFEAYQNEAEPHDRTRYKEAVKECQRSRAEEAKKHNTKNNDNSSHAVVNDKSKKSFNSGIGTILGGAGALFASAKKAAKEFKSIDDSSELEADLNKEFQNQIERRQRQMAENHRRAAENDKRMQSNAKRREKELKKLRALEQKFIARENKKKIFSNLHAIFSRKDDDIMIIPDEIICKYSGISSPNHKATVSQVMKGYRQCLNEVGSSEKFIQCWSEIIYLIEEGVLFKDKHVKQFVTIISNICGQMNNDVSKDISEFNDCLKIFYLQLKNAYWGYNFEKNPKEDIIKKRINYLSNTLFFDEDMDENVEFEEAYDLYEDEDNQFKDNIECTNDENADEDDDIEDDDIEDDEDEDEEDDDEEEDEEENGEEKNTKRPESSYDNQNEDKTTISAGKYSDLACIGFSKDNSTEDFKEPKNFLDIITKNRNKKIAKKKEKWNDALWNLDHRLKKSVLKDLLHIEEDINKFLKLEEEKNNLTQNGHTSGFFGLGGSKELKKVKSDIKEIKENIEKEQTNLTKSLRELRYCERAIKDIQEELFELTQLEKYADFTPLEGNGISIVEQLVRCKKITNTETLRNIFDL